jgi:alcohol dehydrogenase class IV
LTKKTPFWSLEEVKNRSIKPIVILSTKSVKQLVEATFNAEVFDKIEDLPNSFGTLIVVGGGALIDEAKLKSIDCDFKLIAIPSVWGSGAEVSAIAVFEENGIKDYLFDEKMLPIAYSSISGIANSLPEHLVRYGCGDTWSHALEGTLSPLGNNATRITGSALMTEMLDIGVKLDERWFQLSADACLLQSQTSVGVIHGIAHTIEPILKSNLPNVDWGHARICSNLLWPVFSQFILKSEKWNTFTSEFDISVSEISSTFKFLFNDDDYDTIKGHIIEAWPQILRHPLTRTNSSLIRRKHLEKFTGDFS